VIGELWRRLWYLVNRSRFERELREEMRAHREMQTADNPRFGNELRLREEAAEAWGWGWLDRLRQDLRFGARLLRRAPAFAVTAIAVLALGIGVNLAAFQIFDAIALTPLPVRAPEQLVNLSSRTREGHWTSFSYPEFDFYRSRSTSLAAAFALVRSSVDLDGLSGTDARFVSASYLVDLGARPLAGRLFDAGDERPGADPVVLLDENAWRRRFGAEAGIVGRTIGVNGHPFTVAGIVPSAFTAFHGRPAVWIPVTQYAAAFSGSALLEDWSAKGAVSVYARLRDGVTVAAARSELGTLAKDLHAARPAETPDGQWIEVRGESTYQPLDEVNRVKLALVTALVLLVFVTACMNLGVLVLARMLGRHREFGLRLSIGASPGRILRQVFTEQVMLGLLGSAAGCAVAAIATRAFAAITALPDGITPHLSWRSSAVAVTLAFLSTVLFGLTPALQAVRPSVPGRLRIRSVLVAVQVAAAGVLLIVSGLLVRGVLHVGRAPLGFDYQHTMVADPDLAAHGVKAAEAAAYWRRLDARVRQVPGVVDAALTTLPPFGNRVAIDAERTIFYHVTPAYFSTLRIPLLRGRLFRDGETGVTIVSEALAQRRWPAGDALGQKYGEAVVIGIVGSARTVRVGEEASSECYQSIEPEEMPRIVMVVRTADLPASAAGTIAAIARAEWTGLTPEVRPLSDALQDKLEGPRRAALLISGLGATALALAVIGLGGLVAFTVSQRTRELGIRLALGAHPRHVVIDLVRQFSLPILCGAIGGSVLAAGAGTILSSELFGVSRFDPVAHVGAMLLFAAVGALAAAPSLRRALRLDPVTTLRHE